MLHHSTLVQRCRTTNSLLADQIEKEFSRLENDRADAGDEIEKLRAGMGKALEFLSSVADVTKDQRIANASISLIKAMAK